MKDPSVLKGVKDIYKVDEEKDQVAYYFIYYLCQLILTYDF
jgi:hypothetical protein